jgi:hypothetical protein
VYTYRTGDAHSAAKRALRIKLRQNETRYVATWRKRQKYRPVIHTSLNELINNIVDYLCKMRDVENARYIQSQRHELFMHLRKVCGDLSYREEIHCTSFFVNNDEYYAYCCGRLDFKPVEAVHPWTDITFFADQYTFQGATQMLTTTFTPGVCIFSKEPVIREIETLRSTIEVDLWVIDLFDTLSSDILELQANCHFGVFPIPLLNGEVVYGIGKKNIELQ